MIATPSIDSMINIFVKEEDDNISVLSQINVQLKGEEIKLITDEEMKKLIDKLEEYERQCKEYLSSNEFKEESKKLESEMEIAQSNLDSWLENLNE